MSLPLLWPIRKSLRKLKDFAQWPGKNIIYRAAEGATASWSQTYSSLLLQSLNKYEEMYFSCCWAVLLPLHGEFELPKTSFVHSLPASVRACVRIAAFRGALAAGRAGNVHHSRGSRGGNKDRDRKDRGGIYIGLVASIKGKEKTGKRSSIWWRTSGTRYSTDRLNFLLIFFPCVLSFERKSL